MFPRLLTAVVLLLVVPAAAGQPGGQSDAIEVFVAGLEQVAATGDKDKVLALTHPEADAGEFTDFLEAVTPAAPRLVLKERDRLAIETGGQRLLLELFVERGLEGRVSTWRVDLKEVPKAGSDKSSPWRIARMERLTVVSGLYRLSIDATRQFDVRNLEVRAPDMTLTMASGSAFVAMTPEGATAVVLVGRGRMTLAPQTKAEQTQIRIFSGDASFDSEFEGAFIRVRPTEFAARFSSESLVPRQISGADFRRAEDIFEEFVGRTLQIDLTDLSRDRWSVVPPTGDLIAEVRTRRFGNLTYARSWGDAEDISFFDRRRRRNIAVYASAEKLAARGHFYSEDDLVDYDVQSHDIDVNFTPDRLWIAGSARLTMKVRAFSLTTLTLRLAESLAVRGVYSAEFGRLLHLRVVGQNSLIVNLPAPVSRGNDVTLTVVYGGRVEPQELDREAIAVDAQDPEPPQIPLEPRFIYSNRSYWYPQSTVTDYATARLRMSVPSEFDVVASGLVTTTVTPPSGPGEGDRSRKMFLFQSDKPARYLACVISRFSTITSAQLKVPSIEVNALRESLARDASNEGSMNSAGPSAAAPSNDEADSEAVALVVQANPRQASRARALSQKSTDVFRFYASLVGEAPYPSFTLAVTESDLPGGHSPAYFAVLNQQLPTSQLVWRNDPVAFESYPSFFLAHELAHQWWGQAIGWKNYHEQWISEGFAQYFAALYGEKERGPETFAGILRQMRRWAIETSDQGPIYLGYRLGHIKSDSRIFRALVYNKGAMVLHMLRRLVGDEVFFTGIRRFYSEWRFAKAGTDDFRRSMEAASNRDLQPFFEGWIYGSSIPRLKVTQHQEGATLLLRFEHRLEVVVVPVTVQITYSTGETHELVVAVGERVVERTVPLKGTIRRVDINGDQASLVEIEK
jgi:hypothetical protein